ncbi:MAG: hypothetical protein QFX37_07365 [Archaeoglobales archaeon]|nr:hypothetical protein [Archaeoglobales archaeon]
MPIEAMFCSKCFCFGYVVRSTEIKFFEGFGEELETTYDIRYHCPNCKKSGILRVEIRDEKLISALGNLNLKLSESGYTCPDRFKNPEASIEFTVFVISAVKAGLGKISVADPYERLHLFDPPSTDTDLLLNKLFERYPKAVINVYKLCTDIRIAEVLEEFVIELYSREIDPKDRNI